MDNYNKKTYKPANKKTKLELSIEQLSQICTELDEIKKINEQIIKVSPQ
jgi:Asp-tRNA(Asn)/Glu-tRNA(Gln) amidotransferase C subunit